MVNIHILVSKLLLNIETYRVTQEKCCINETHQTVFLFDPLLIKHVQNLKGADTHVTQFGIYNKILNKADNQTFDY